ncbi:MAG: OmpA family protein [Elusimicrobiota bacterium]|nr:OmpA family protein [Endomicrobiia bacterium]MDW8165761.1 OmpA family protein [Elusimicrobiota bacterium]
MTKKFFIFIFLFVSFVYCIDNFDLLLIPFGVRATGGGGNFVSMYDTSEGLFYNPAVAVASRYSEVVVGHHIYYADTSLQQLACNASFGWFGFGITAVRFATSEIPIIDNYYPYDETFSMSSLLSGVSLCLAPIKNICLGFSYKYIEEEIFRDINSSFLYDVGWILRTNNDLFSISGALQNFSTTEKYNIPTLYNLGLRLYLDLPHQATKINILAAAKIDYKTNDVVYSFGIEHWGSDVLGIRVGYIVDEKKNNLNIYEQISFFTAGISLNISNFGIDYSYLPNSALGTTHNLGVSFKFKTKKEIKISELSCGLNVSPLYFSPNNDGVLDNVFFRPDISTTAKVTDILYSVKDINNKEVFVFTSTFVSTMVDTFYTFDGKDLNKNTLMDGEYYVEFMMRQKENGKINIYKSSKEKFIVDTISPNININLSTNTISPDGDNIDDSLKFFVSIYDEGSPIESVDCGIFNFKNQKIYTYKVEISTLQNKLDLELIWAGKDEIYESVVPNGEYKIIVLAKDKAGNKMTKEEKFRVYVAPKQMQQKVVVEKHSEIFYIKGAKVTIEDRGIVITYPTDELFIKETKEISPKLYSSLDSLAEIIKNKYSDRKILIEGHTDSVGDAQENRAKSSAFAWKVYSYLVKNCGLDGKLLEVKGYGEERPIASNRTKLGRAKNRRIEIVIPIPNQ